MSAMMTLTLWMNLLWPFRSPLTWYGRTGRLLAYMEGRLSVLKGGKGKKGILKKIERRSRRKTLISTNFLICKLTQCNALVKFSSGRPNFRDSNQGSFPFAGGDFSDCNFLGFGGSLQSNRMATEGNGRLGSSEEVREGQLMGPALERLGEYLMDNSIQNPCSSLEAYIRRLAREVFEHLAKSGPAMVGGSSSVSYMIAGQKRVSDSSTVGEGEQQQCKKQKAPARPSEILEVHTVDTQKKLETCLGRIESLETRFHRLVSEIECVVPKLVPDMDGGRFGGSLQSNRMATEENGGLGSSEEVREGQLMGPALECVAEFLMDDSIQNPCSLLESYIRRLAREEYELFAKPSPALVGGSSVNRRGQIQEPDRRILQLCFQTNMPDHFFVGKKVEGRDGAICVKLIDATTGHVVVSGPLSSLTPVVVVLAGDFNNKDDGDWTWEDFISNVETGREGKGPLLEGDLQVPLKEGEGSLGEFKFTDISTCRPSRKYRLGVIFEAGFFNDIRVREAKTTAFEVKHYKKKSEEKHVMRALDDDVCTLKGIGKNGRLQENLNKVGIFKVKDFLWKLGLDPEGSRKILGKTVSHKNWKTVGDHANKSVPRGKRHVYYADNTKNSGVVFKNMSELCGLIEGGEYHSAETLSDRQKVSADDLKKEACAKWENIVEYDGLQLLEMNPSERARSSQTDVVTGASDSCPSVIDLPSSSYVGPPVNPGLDIGVDDSIGLPSSPRLDLSEKADGNTALSFGSLDAFCREVYPSHLPESSRDPSEQADGNRVFSVGAHGGSFERGKQLGGSNLLGIGLYSRQAGG